MCGLLCYVLYVYYTYCIEAIDIITYRNQLTMILWPTTFHPSFHRCLFLLAYSFSICYSLVSLFQFAGSDCRRPPSFLEVEPNSNGPFESVLNESYGCSLVLSQLYIHTSIYTYKLNIHPHSGPSCFTILLIDILHAHVYRKGIILVYTQM